VSKLESVTKESLSKWFVDNYILKCTRRCFDNTPAFNHFFNFYMIGEMSLKDMVSFIDFHRGRLMLPHEICHEFSSSQFRLLCVVTQYSLTRKSCSYLMSELANIDYRLSVYFIAVAFLHVAYKTSRDSLTDELLGVLVTICRLSTQMPIIRNAQSRFYKSFTKCDRRRGDFEHHKTPVTPRHSSELVELLQQSAVEHLTILCQIEARDFRDQFVMVASEYEALYAYKHGDYQRCLQLSKPNVRTFRKAPLLWQGVYAVREFIQLLDDDIASLAGLVIVVNLLYRRDYLPYPISQLTLSLYLVTRCQMRLHHSVTSLTKTLGYIRHARREHFRRSPSRWFALSDLLLKLVERRTEKYIKNGRP